MNLFLTGNHQFSWENCIKLTFSGCPPKFCHRVMYIAPSSGHISLNFNMPFKLILRSFEVVFWDSGVRMLHFLKDWWIFIQIHQYYTMALMCTWWRGSTKIILWGDDVNRWIVFRKFWVELEVLVSWYACFLRQFNVVSCP